MRSSRIPSRSRRRTRAIPAGPPSPRGPGRDDGVPGAGRRQPGPAGHVADEGGARARWSPRAAWRPCAASGSCPALAAPASTASGLALKIEDGDGYERGTWAASVEALRQVGVLEGQALRVLARYHRPPDLDPHGRVGAEAVASFDLAPVGELTG